MICSPASYINGAETNFQLFPLPSSNPFWLQFLLHNITHLICLFKLSLFLVVPQTLVPKSGKRAPSTALPLHAPTEQRINAIIVIKMRLAHLYLNPQANSAPSSTTNNKKSRRTSNTQLTSGMKLDKFKSSGPYCWSACVRQERPCHKQHKILGRVIVRPYSLAHSPITVLKDLCPLPGHKGLASTVVV